MINVAIVTTNDNVAYAMSTVITKRGAKCRHIKNYSFREIKTCNIVIFDLDHIQGFEDQIKKDSAGFKDLIVLGYGRQNDIMEDFKAIMTVREKPLLSEHFSKCLQDLKLIKKTEYIVNTEENPIYDRLGFNPDSLLDTDILSDRERLQKLKTVVEKHYDGPGEGEFLEKIGLKNVEIDRSSEITVLEKKRVIDYRSQFVDDALIMYRAKKLRQMRLSLDEIDAKIQEMMMLDVNRNHIKRSLFSESDILDGFTSTKRYIDIKQEISSMLEPANTNVKNNETNQLKKDISIPDITIEQQRRDAIYDEPIGTVDKDDSTAITYTATEQKYLKSGNGSNQIKSTLQQQGTHSAHDVPGVVLSSAELSDRLNKKLSPEQIEKLRKLGVKI